MKLKPCPFCGEVAIPYVRDDGWPGITCLICPAEMIADTEESVAKKWNTRAKPKRGKKK